MCLVIRFASIFGVLSLLLLLMGPRHTAVVTENCVSLPLTLSDIAIGKPTLNTTSINPIDEFEQVQNLSISRNWKSSLALTLFLHLESSNKTTATLEDLMENTKALPKFVHDRYASYINYVLGDIADKAQHIEPRIQKPLENIELYNATGSCAVDGYDVFEDRQYYISYVFYLWKSFVQYISYILSQLVDQLTSFATVVTILAEDISVPFSSFSTFDWIPFKKSIVHQWNNCCSITRLGNNDPLKDGDKAQHIELRIQKLIENIEPYNATGSCAVDGYDVFDRQYYLYYVFYLWKSFVQYISYILAQLVDQLTSFVTVVTILTEDIAVPFSSFSTFDWIPFKKSIVHQWNNCCSITRPGNNDRLKDVLYYNEPRILLSDLAITAIGLITTMNLLFCLKITTFIICDQPSCRVSSMDEDDETVKADNIEIEESKTDFDLKSRWNVFFQDSASEICLVKADKMRDDKTDGSFYMLRKSLSESDVTFTRFRKDKQGLGVTSLSRDIVTTSPTGSDDSCNSTLMTNKELSSASSISVSASSDVASITVCPSFVVTSHHDDIDYNDVITISPMGSDDSCNSTLMTNMESSSASSISVSASSCVPSITVCPSFVATSHHDDIDYNDVITISPMGSDDSCNPTLMTNMESSSASSSSVSTSSPVPSITRVVTSHQGVFNYNDIISVVAETAKCGLQSNRNHRKTRRRTNRCRSYMDSYKRTPATDSYSSIDLSISNIFKQVYF